MTRLHAELGSRNLGIAFQRFLTDQERYVARSYTIALFEHGTENPLEAVEMKDAGAFRVVNYDLGKSQNGTA